MNPILASHGLALPTMGSLANITIGALFAGPDHGSSAFHPVCAGNARGATIVLPPGEVRRIEKGKDDLFDAAAAGVGAVGIVTEVEWACEEAFGLEVTMEPCRLEDYLDKHDSGEKLWELARSSDYVKVRMFLSLVCYLLATPVMERLNLILNSAWHAALVLPVPYMVPQVTQYGPLASAPRPSPTRSTRNRSHCPPRQIDTCAPRPRLLCHDLSLSGLAALAERALVLAVGEISAQDANAEGIRGAVHGLWLQP